MALSSQEFHAHALRAADRERRLPLSRMTYWDIFPFEPAALQVVPLAEPQVPEPVRAAGGGIDCRSCANADNGIWRSERWRLTRTTHTGLPLVLMLHCLDHHDLSDLPDDLAGELGVLTVHIARAVESLEHVARAHVTRWGDGSAHLHLFFWARPEGHLQLRGSCLPVWDDLLPEYPDDEASADAARVVDALVESYGGTATPPPDRR